MVIRYHCHIEQASNQHTGSHTNTHVDSSERRQQTSSIKPNPLEFIIFRLLCNNWFKIKRMYTTVCTRRSSSPLLQIGIGMPCVSGSSVACVYTHHQGVGHHPLFFHCHRE